MARRGFSVLELLVCIALAGVLIGIALCSVQRVRAAAARLSCQNQLHQLALAAQSHHDSVQHWPTGWTSPSSQKLQFLGWPARLLPYLERETIWRDILSDFQAQPHPFRPKNTHHREILALAIPAFQCPADARVAQPQKSDYGTLAGFSSFVGVSGRDHSETNGIFYADSKIRHAQITDGLSNTIVLGERPPTSEFRLGWWYCGIVVDATGVAETTLGVREMNTSLDYRECAEGPYHFQSGDPRNRCDNFHFWSKHFGGANFAFADGSVRFMSYGVDSLLPALSTRAGGEPITVTD